MATLQEMRESLKGKQGELEALNKTITERRAAGKSGSDLWSETEQKQYETLTSEIANLSEDIAAEERADSLQGHLDQANEQRARQRTNGRTDPRQSDLIPGTETEYGELYGDRDLSRQAAQLEERRAYAMHAWACEERAGDLITDAHRDALEKLKVSPLSALSFQGHDNSSVQTLRGILGTGLVTIENRAQAMSHLERRSIGYDSNYQSWVPDAFRNAFEIAFHGLGGVMSECDLLVTEMAEKLPWPFGDDTANEGHQVDEGTPENLAGVDPEIVIPRLGAYDFTSGFARMAKALLANSPFDLAALLGNMLGERVARAMERKLTNGNRVDTFGGYMHRGVQGATVPIAAPVSVTALQKLIWAVITEHRDRGCLALHDGTLAAFASLVDGNNQPLLNIGNGRLQYAKDVSVRYKVTNYLKSSADPTLAAGDKIIAFGNFKQQKVRIVRQIRLERFNEKFAESHQAAFMANRSGDSDLLRSSQTANCPIKYIETTV